MNCAKRNPEPRSARRPPLASREALHYEVLRLCQDHGLHSLWFPVDGTRRIYAHAIATDADPATIDVLWASESIDILCLHGTGSASAVYIPLSLRIRNKGLSAVAVDWPGWGLSDAGIALDVFLAAVLRRWRPRWIVAHSVACVVVRAVALPPGTWVIECAPPGYVPLRPAVRWMIEHGVPERYLRTRAVARLLDTRWGRHLWSWLHPDAPEFWRQLLCHGASADSWRILREWIRRAASPPAVASPLAPVAAKTVIMGRADPLFQLRHEGAAAVDIWLPGVGHSVVASAAGMEAIERLICQCL